MGVETVIKEGVDVEVIPEESEKIRAFRPVCNKWQVCAECGNEILKDLDGEFYHLLRCSRSNGIGYGSERNRTPKSYLTR